MTDPNHRVAEQLRRATRAREGPSRAPWGTGVSRRASRRPEGVQPADAVPPRAPAEGRSQPADPPDPAQIRNALRAMLAAPDESLAFQRHSKHAKAVLAQHPEVRERLWRHRRNGRRQQQAGRP